ncbi:MAG: 30S ribosome-binding factor RbfA [Chloroflexota bacterium]|nr:30S ribosome-binding factor RbfA [Chloroflexota bacterium]
MTGRTVRIDHRIQHEVMDLVQRELADPRVGFVTVTRVETSKDLRHARVWVSVLGTPDERNRAMVGLRQATPWLRRRVGERLQLRYVPQLTLRQDDSIESGDRVLRLLSEIEPEPGPREP